MWCVFPTLYMCVCAFVYVCEFVYVSFFLRVRVMFMCMCLYTRNKKNISKKVKALEILARSEKHFPYNRPILNQNGLVGIT